MFMVNGLWYIKVFADLLCWNMSVFVCKQIDTYIYLSIHYWNPAQWYIHVPCFLQNTKNNHWSEFDKRNIFKSSLIVSNAICCKNSYYWTTYIFFSLSWFWAQFLDLSKCLQIYVKYLALTFLNILCIWFILDKSCMHVIAAGL